MITFTKEQLIASAHARIEFAEMMLAGELEPLKERTWSIELELARIVLASLEAEPLCYLTWHQGFRAPDDCEEYVVEAKPGDKSCDGTPAFPVYTAPPAPVSVPAAMEMDDDFDSAFEHGKAVGWNAYRAAMLQGADGTLTNEGTIPVTQFKPVADLYGLTSPTGGETSFTFDAVEARDFIDGGWSCQEYVELGRFQEAMLQNGNSPAQSDCCPEQNYIAPAQDGDSPVIPDGWVACSERMPDIDTEIFYFCKDDGLRDCGIVSSSNFSDSGDAQLYVHAEGYDLRLGVDITHWMPLPAAPQQEVK
ncbi:DUF551 domain-containing protein [Enterobacter hormaechei]|uniref:DUF551 domain-containing protein n=1 Tax=Enterobacter hormaechei TaxID=158836 RepID=UPI0025B2842A|nr:DUF551 domain-containing protein [Enterobacter hormaechei]MDN3797341.1 DUF551 domain-containing protein [Enterobacter hormaechei]